jgi:hypothetical protein
VTCFEREQCKPFEYSTKNGKRTLTSYWRLPDRLYDDADELAQWAKQALATARRGAAVKPKAEKKRMKTKPWLLRWKLRWLLRWLPVEFGQLLAFLLLEVGDLSLSRRCRPSAKADSDGMNLLPTLLQNAAREFTEIKMVLPRVAALLPEYSYCS